MATRSETLDRLAVASPCSQEWEGMAGDERQRFCGQCRRDVLDFSRLTAREIQAHLEAGGGRVCARVTWNRGRLVHLPDPDPVALSSRRSVERRVSPVAATFVTALLTAGLAQARAGEAEAAKSAPSASASKEAGMNPAAKKAATASASAALRGRVTDIDSHALPGVTLTARNRLDGSQGFAVSEADGSYRFESLPAGLYDLTAELEGFHGAERRGISLKPGKERKVALRLKESKEEVITILTGETALPVDPPRPQLDASPRGES